MKAPSRERLLRHQAKMQRKFIGIPYWMFGYRRSPSVCSLEYIWAHDQMIATLCTMSQQEVDVLKAQLL